MNNRLDLETLFGDTTFPRLQSFGLCGLFVKSNAIEELLDRHRKTLRRLSLTVNYLPSLKETGSSVFFGGSATTRHDEQVHLAGFLAELKKGLVDGMGLISSVNPKLKFWELRKHISDGIYLLDLGDEGYGDDGWILDTGEGV